MYPYVYLLEHEETKEFYIGSRSCKCKPEKDKKYLGSMKTWNPDKSKLIKSIIKSDFENREECMLYESEMIKEYIEDDLNRNYHIPVKGFHTVGLVAVKDLEGKNFKVSVDDERYLSGELVGVTKGKVTVKDKDGNTFQVSVKDERYLSGVVSHITKGKVTVKDKNGNTFIVSVDDKRYLSGELVGIAKGQITVKDKNGNTFAVSVNDPRYLNGELVHNLKYYKFSEETKNKIGLSNSKHQKGSGNSQFGTCWIYSEIEKFSKKIKNENLEIWISKGWKKGRKIKF